MPWTAPEGEPQLDPSLTAGFQGCLPGGRMAGPLVAYRSVPSTQTLCRRLGAAGVSEGAVVVADHQTAGRGRRGRVWQARPGVGLLFSCLLRPNLPPARWSELTVTAAVAVAEAIETTAEVTARLKWPNDVLVGDRKLAGVLAQGVVGPTPFVVLGVGINVGGDHGQWPADLATRAVSLAELGHPVSREALLAAVLARLLSRYERLLLDGPAIGTDDEPSVASTRRAP